MQGWKEVVGLEPAWGPQRSRPGAGARCLPKGTQELWEGPPRTCKPALSPLAVAMFQASPKAPPLGRGAGILPGSCHGPVVWRNMSPTPACTQSPPRGSRTSLGALSIAGRPQPSVPPFQGRRRPLLLQRPHKAVGTTPTAISDPNQDPPCPWQTLRPRLGNAARAFLGRRVLSASGGTRVAS